MPIQTSFGAKGSANEPGPVSLEKKVAQLEAKIAQLQKNEKVLVDVIESHRLVGQSVWFARLKRAVYNAATGQITQTHDVHGVRSTGQSSSKH